MNADSKMIMTVRIDRTLAARFSGLMEEIGLRRDAYLNKVLPGEVERLSALPPNTDRAAKYVRLNSQIQADKDARFSLKLDTSLVNRITTVCRQKGIPRDQFIVTFLDYLVNGYEGHEGDPYSEVPPPLGKASDLLCNPYHEANGELNIYESLHLPDSLFERGLFKLMLEDVVSREQGKSTAKGRKENT